MSDGWCVCGLAANDPQHGPWHKVLLWNRRILDEQDAAAQAAFADDLGWHDKRHGRTPGDRQGELEVGAGGRSTFRYSA